MVGIHEEFIEKHGDASHNNITRPRGYMSDETFEKIIAEAKLFGIAKIQLHFQGEPLLHKQLIPMLARLRKEGFEVQFFTNGLLLNDELAQQIIDAKVNMVRFSIDGTSQETYVINRVGGEFDKAYDNLKTMANLARGTNTRVEWQFIVLSNNEHQVEQARKLAGEIGVNLVLKTFAVTEKELTPKNKKHIRGLKKKPCKDIYSHIGIYWNGDVVACCYDTDGRNILGNINKNSLEGIWNSEAYRTFRECVDNVNADNREKDPDLCRTCLRWGI